MLELEMVKNRLTNSAPTLFSLEEIEFLWQEIYLPIIQKQIEKEVMCQIQQNS